MLSRNATTGARLSARQAATSAHVQIRHSVLFIHGSLDRVLTALEVTALALCAPSRDRPGWAVTRKYQQIQQAFQVRTEHLIGPGTMFLAGTAGFQHIIHALQAHSIPANVS
jgi:hypothetical protein